MLSNLKIKTPSGFSTFSGIRKVRKSGRVSVYTTNKHLTCSFNHRVLTGDGWAFAKNLKIGDILSNENIKEIILEEGEFDFYDALDVSDGNAYLTNDIVSHNCEFLGGANTLINPNILKNIPFIEPLHSSDNYQIFSLPEKEHKYVIVSDCARGLGLDYSTFLVIDVSVLPYVVVCKYRSRLISPTMLPNMIFDTANRYNKAMVLIELNDVGEMVANILWSDLEYENIFMTNNKDRVSEGASTKNLLGVKTSKKTKKQGCTYIKSLIESYKLVINDFDIIEELSSFVQMKNSYEAEPGAHDDLVMCLVIFGWLINQDYYKSLMDINIRDRILQDNRNRIEEELMPFGSYDDGLDDIEEEYNANW